MSDAVDDMLSGFACQVCGVFFDDCLPGGKRCKPTGEMMKGKKPIEIFKTNPPGHPRTCRGCK